MEKSREIRLTQYSVRKAVTQTSSTRPCLPALAHWGIKAPAHQPTETIAYIIMLHRWFGYVLRKVMVCGCWSPQRGRWEEEPEEIPPGADRCHSTWRGSTPAQEQDWEQKSHGISFWKSLRGFPWRFGTPRRARQFFSLTDLSSSFVDLNLGTKLYKVFVLIENSHHAQCYIQRLVGCSQPRKQHLCPDFLLTLTESLDSHL